MEHINESILSEEIKEHQKEARIDHMVYLPGMEALKSDITKQVVEAMEAYDYDSYTAEDVRYAWQKETAHRKILRRCCRRRQNRLSKRWHSVQKWKKKIILAIRSVFLRRSISPIIVKIIVSTAGLTVITVSAGQN